MNAKVITQHRIKVEINNLTITMYDLDADAFITRINCVDEKQAIEKFKKLTEGE